MDASFEEKSAWIQLIALVVVLGGYFVTAAHMLRTGVTEIVAFAPLFIISVVLLVIVLGVSHAVVAILSRVDGRDERDRLIEWRAESNSSWILGAGVITAVTGLVMQVGGVWVAHLLMLALLASEVAKLVFQLVYYRRGL